MEKVRQVSRLTKEELTQMLDSFDNVLCDCDGVIYSGGVVLPGAVELLNYLSNKRKKRIFFVSNNAAKDRQMYFDGLTKMGFPVQLDHIFHSGYITADFIHGLKLKKVYLVAPKAVCHELDKFAIAYEYKHRDDVPLDWNDEYITEELLGKMDPEVDCVLVSFDVDFSYVKVARAANYLRKSNTKFFVTDADASFPISGDQTLPGPGPIVSAVATTAEREPTIVGKPSKHVFDCIQKHFPDVTAERSIIFGDRAESDILLGYNSGVKTVLVGTGVDTLQSACSLNLCPNYWTKGLDELWNMIKELQK